jgi:uncharacterized protein YhaN
VNILRLHMKAFGPFTGWELDLSAPGLHIVYGRNEAGKSAALRGLKALLFGIDERTTDNFVHKNPKLRLAGTLRRADGRTLDIVRRKGRAQTLLTPDDEVLDDRVLDEFLGGVGADQFSRMFGLGHEELARGGREIVSGKGDIGESLFAAALGGRGVQQILEPLEKEANDLFRRNAPKTTVNSRMQEYLQAAGEAAQASLPASDWQEHTRLLNEARDRRDAIAGDLRRIEAEAARLKRIHNAIGFLGERKEVLAKRAAMGQVLILPRDHAERRRRTIEELERARASSEKSTRRIAELETKIAALSIPEALLDRAGDITRLHESLGSHAKAMEDLPKLVAQAEQLEAEAARILAEVYPAGGEGPAVKASLGTRQTVRELGGRREALAQVLRKTKKSLDALQSKADRAREVLQRTPAPRDPAELREVLKRAQRQGDLEKEYAKLQARIKAESAQAQMELNRLTLWTGTLDQAEGLPVPSEETGERFDRELRKCELELTAVEAKLKDAKVRESDISGKIRELEMTSAVVTEADLSRARAHRDAGWNLVKASWLQGRGDGPEIEAFAGSQSLEAAYEGSVHESDETADRLRREADRVAVYAARTAERDRAADEVRNFSQERDALAAGRSALQQDWKQLWRNARVDPLSPSEMRAWLRRLRSLVEQAGKIRASRQEADTLGARIAALREEIVSVLLRFETAPPENGAGLNALVDRGQSLLESIEASSSEHRTRETNVSELEQQVAEAEREVHEAEAALQAWQNEWATALQRLRLEGTESPEVVSLLLDKLQEFAKKEDKAADLQKRIDGIRRDSREFSRQAQQLGGEFAPELPGVAVDAIVKRLNDRLALARADMATRAQLCLQATEQKEILAESAEMISGFEARLREMCIAARCADPRELEAVENRSESARGRDHQLENLSMQLLAFTAGGSIEDLAREAMALDADGLPAVIEDLYRRGEELRSELSQVEQAIGQEKGELARMDGGSRAAEAAERAQSSLAQVREGLERYVQLKLASIVLRREIERYRADNQTPVLKRASEIFARLTLGSFASLKPDFDAGDRPVLVGVRGTGEEVAVDGMSAGTCDQLYLSLRLASLEKHLQGREPMPFVIDDILVNFDDARSEATLSVLGELSSHTQVLFFTHHEHLLGLAANAVLTSSMSIHRM